MVHVLVGFLHHIDASDAYVNVSLTHIGGNVSSRKENKSERKGDAVCDVEAGRSVMFHARSLEKLHALLVESAFLWHGHQRIRCFALVVEREERAIHLRMSEREDEIDSMALPTSHQNTSQSCGEDLREHFTERKLQLTREHNILWWRLSVDLVSNMQKMPKRIVLASIEEVKYLN